MINDSRTSKSANLLRSASPTLIVSALILIALYLISLQSYLIFHGVIEIISVAIAVSIFILIWNTRQTAHDTFFLIIGISLLFIGSIDLIHMLAYKGMGVFPGNSSDLPTQLWIAARYFQSIAFFAAALLIGKSLSKDRKYDVWIIFAACAAAFILLMMSIFVWQNFPPCFIDGSGLTPFKIASEYVISLIMAATIGVLVIKKRYLDTEVWYLLIAAQLFLIFGELAFTSYISVYGFMNMLGHLFKLIAFYLFYRAIVVVGLTRPYALIFRELKESEENLRESENKLNDILRNSPIPQFVIDRDHKVIHWNEALERYSGIAAKDIVGTNQQWRAFYRDERPCMADLLLDGLIEKIPHWYCGKYEKSKRNEDAYEAIDFFPHMNGSGLWLHFTAAPIRDTAGQITGAVETLEDITEIKNTEAYRQLSTDVLGILNEPAELQEMIRRVLDAIKRATNADAIGIRLKAADDFPYFVEKGFSNDFLLTENTLVAREQNGGICRNSESNVNLECTCGLVISGKTDPKNPLFTQGGSFWTNHSFPLLDLPSGQDLSEFRLRNTCIHKGYTSVAIIPIRTHQQQIIGTLQINCFKKNCFTISGIQSLELIAGHISEALMRKTAEMALVESEDKFRSLTESSPDYILRYDRQCRHTYINPAALRAYEREEEQMLGKTDRENGLDESMSRFWEETITGVFETKKLFQTQIAWERVNGSILLDVMLTPEFSEDNTVRSVLSVLRDVTQIERAEEALLKKNEELSASYEQITTSEEALRETNDYLNNLFDYANAPIIVWDTKLRITRFNHAFEHLTGRKAKDVLQQPLAILFPEESRDTLLDLIKTTTGGERWETVKIPILAADGTVHTVLWNSANILSTDGELESTIAQGVDITLRERAEVALRESEEQSRTISNSLLFGIVIVDAKTHAIIDVNDKALEMIGGGRDIVIGSVCHRFICPAEPGKCPVTDLGQTVNCSDRVLLNISGERIPIFKSVVRTTLKGKDVLIESFVDITERKRSEEALIDSERTINILLNAVPDNLALINHEKMIIAVNESMAATLGQQPEALTGKAILDFLTSSVLYDTIDRSIDSTMTGGQMYFEERQNERWLETSVYPVTDRNGTEVRIVIQSRDITERKYLEEELKKVGLSQAELNIEKFQTLNDQIRNPLQVIRGYTSLDPSKYNDKINKQVEIIDNIVTQLDMGWLESEKVQQFLLKHSQHSNQSLRKQQTEGGLR